jgi:hypothetical protein
MTLPLERRRYAALLQREAKLCEIVSFKDRLKNSSPANHRGEKSMRTANRLVSLEISLAFVLALLSGLMMPAPANAQVGDNTIWISPTATGPSSAFIDATAFCHTAGSCSSSTDDFCTVVFNALNSSSFPATGGVVDARGLNSSNTKSTSCSSGSPFQTTSAAIKVPSTVLLPAGVIPLGKVWVLPNGTKIIGQGAGSPFSSSGTDAVTIIQATSSFSGTMIQMGPNSGDPLFTPCSSATAGYCTEVGVENLELVGGSNGANVSGIINGQSQDMSYVRRVSMYEIGGIGLKVWNTGENSGPYWDISYNTGSVGSGSTSTECVELDVNTLGVRGLDCVGSTSPAASAAVVVNASNNTLKDVKIQGAFTDGIQVKPGVSSDVLFNVSGGSESGVTNLVHIESGTTNPQDISVMGVGNGGGSSVTILDSVTSTSLNDSYIGMYVLGVSGVGGNGYSRFTTSPNTNAITWGTGNSLPGSCSKGSLFSCTGGSSCNNSSCTGSACGTSDLFVCISSPSWASLP